MDEAFEASYPEENCSLSVTVVVDGDEQRCVIASHYGVRLMISIYESADWNFLVTNGIYFRSPMGFRWALDMAAMREGLLGPPEIRLQG